MIPAEYRRTVVLLVKKTQGGKVRWLTTGDENTFMVRLKEFSLAVSYDSRRIDLNDTYSSYVTLSLINKQGGVIDTFEVVDDEETDWSLVNTLYNAARREALDITTAIKKFEEELEKDDVVGEAPGEAPQAKADEIPF